MHFSMTFEQNLCKNKLQKYTKCSHTQIYKTSSEIVQTFHNIGTVLTVSCKYSYHEIIVTVNTKLVIFIRHQTCCTISCTMSVLHGREEEDFSPALRWWSCIHLRLMTFSEQSCNHR